jgi:hypothetical protein
VFPAHIICTGAQIIDPGLAIVSCQPTLLYGEFFAR